MSLIHSNEQLMLKDSAQKFFKEKSPLSQIRYLRDSNDIKGFDASVWSELSEMGFTSVLVPEHLGGMGMGHVEAGIISEQIGHQLTAVPFLSTSIAAIAAICHAGTDLQKKKWLPKFISAKAIGTLAVDEQPKHQPELISLEVIANEFGFVLNGSKTFVLDGHVADVFVVAARRAGDPGDKEGITLFLVDSDTPGITVERTLMVDYHNAARVTFNDVKVVTDRVLGNVDEGWQPLTVALDAARICAASELLGLADEAFARTIEYLKTRKQFGRLIGEFQALQHRMSQLYCELEITRSAIIFAQKQLDSFPETSSWDVSVAKARAGLTANLAVQEAIQMHGGIGMTDEFDIGFFMKRARVLQELFGDSNFHLNQIALLKNY